LIETVGIGVAIFYSFAIYPLLLVLVGPASIVKTKRTTLFDTGHVHLPKLSAILHRQHARVLHLLEDTLPMVVEFWDNPVGKGIPAHDPYPSRRAKLAGVLQA
jgi:hypothetical protein